MPWQDHFTRDELIARIRRLAADDLTREDVAFVIGCGLTKDMVAGFANRAKPKIVFGAKRREERSSRLRVPASEAAPPTRSGLKFVILDEVEHFGAPGGVHFSDLRSVGGLRSGVPPRIADDRCRYPLWPDRTGTSYRPQPFELVVCGKPVVPGTSWCSDCLHKVFERVEPKPRPKRDRNGRRAGWEYGF